jgi:hypothetical protein
MELRVLEAGNPEADAQVLPASFEPQKSASGRPSERDLSAPFLDVGKPCNLPRHS